MPIKVFLIDKTQCFRETLVNKLTDDTEIEIVGSFSDSKFAKIALDKEPPDVCIVSIENSSDPIIDFINSTSINIIALGHSSILPSLKISPSNFLIKPKSDFFFDVFLTNLSRKIKLLSVSKKTSSVTPTVGISSKNIIAIGASTGGTEAIIKVVKDLPVTTPGIVIVQHMPPIFTKMYADRLNKICKMSAKEAKDYDRVERGKIIIAAGDKHMSVSKDSNGYYVKCTAGATVSGHCPSVDVLFESVAITCGSNAIGVILTGMGFDGAIGITKMRKRGAYTIGQDKETCVVYGMPMEAYNLGGISKQLPLESISKELLTF